MQIVTFFKKITSTGKTTRVKKSQHEVSFWGKISNRQNVLSCTKVVSVDMETPATTKLRCKYKISFHVWGKFHQYKVIIEKLNRDFSLLRPSIKGLSQRTTQFRNIAALSAKSTNIFSLKKKKANYVFHLLIKMKIISKSIILVQNWVPLTFIQKTRY